MLTLNDGRSELWQWDTGRTLAVDADCSQVHFSNKVFGRSIDVDVIDGVATIPDILLQTDKDLNVWAFVGTAENGYTKISKTFKVNRRNKPADYVFTPVEQTTLSELVGRLDKIEESQDPDAIKNAVEDYLEQNPVEAPVQSVNGKTGAVELKASDVGAISQEDLQNATNEALTQAKGSGAFDGPEGPQGPQGDPGPAGADGPPGDDYVLTDADRQEIAEIAAGLVEVPNVKPVAKTADMTQPVGVDEEGRLWSAPLTVNIPEGGGGTWELIGEITSDGAGNSGGIYVPIDFTQYKEIHVEAVDTIDGELMYRLKYSNNTEWYGGETLTSVKRAEIVMHSVHTFNVSGELKNIAGYASGFIGGSGIHINNSPRTSMLASDFKFICLDANGTVVPEGATLKVWGCK